MKRMLINATQPEELRVAMVDGQWLYDLDIENRTREQKKANIYKGVITRIEPSLEAAFVNYGAERHGFLPLKEISREYFLKQPKDVEGRIKIKDMVKEGQEVIVQVDKEERGNKGAALTTFISLAGRYLVLMPNNPRAGGISRRIDGEDRSQLRDAMADLEVPSGMGVIARTAGVGRSAEELQWDLDYLLQLWTNIKSKSDELKAPYFLFRESNVIIRAIRDYLRPDIGDVFVDNEKAYNEALEFVQQVMPAYASKIKLYKSSTSLFSHYQIESQIQTAFQREVKLPSGGSIVIDVTEALVSIDINSARATKGGDIEETALQTNLEAADEIARQLRLRDIGGLQVIDFIDMQSPKNQREVENRLRDALSMDRARVQTARISRFGLLEMSRQRLRPSLGETTSKVCPRCSGQGTILSTKPLALSILRLIEEEAQKERSAEIRAITPVSVGTYLLNEKRASISEIEHRNNTRVVIVPSEELTTPHFEVQRLRDDDDSMEEVSYKISHTTEEATSEPKTVAKESSATEQSTPAVQHSTPAQPAPEPPKAPGLLTRLVKWISGLFEEEPKPKKHNRKKSGGKGYENRRNRNDRHRNRRRDNRNRRDNDDERQDKQKTERTNGRHHRNDDRRQHEDKDSRDHNRDRKQKRRSENGSRQQHLRNNGSNVSSEGYEENRSRSNAQDSATQDSNINGDQQRPARRPNNKRARPQQRRRGRREDLIDNEQTSTQLTESENLAKSAPATTSPINEAVSEKPSSSQASSTQQHNASIAEPRPNVEAPTTTSESEMESSANTSADNKAPDSMTLETAASQSLTSETVVSKNPEDKVDPTMSTDKAGLSATEAKNSVETPETDSHQPEKEAQENSLTKPTAVANPETEQPSASTSEVASNANADMNQNDASESEQTTPEDLSSGAPQVEPAPVSAGNERAINDPRVNPKPISTLEVRSIEHKVTLSQPLNTAEPAEIERKPRQLQRPANDPRNQRGLSA
ncbi:ribonuclease E [Marinibactrum halimedae]|uniref:Ribonuclease E n=1 Tax=Marinibactrum halimedae TaxID=1444977 RepID=A0AA37TCA9_9GAMM|nr:ribonuclease E [Marinibactrum halimedae]MCD9460116.1 ribonuclease E [Marinibactrum halimedae]GLS26517.1 ribonuclease E [Marinibactrum halimedae]